MSYRFDPHFVNPCATNKATVYLYISDVPTPYGHIPATSMTLHNALAITKAMRRHFNRYCAVTLESTNETVFADRKNKDGKSMRMMYWHSNSICVTYYPHTGDYEVTTKTVYSPTYLTKGEMFSDKAVQTDTHKMYIRRLG